MITYKDIKKAVNTRLSTKFEGIEINSNDVTEGFNRPSFFVQITNPIRTGEVDQVYKSLTVQVYYFPTNHNDNSIELLEIQESLESAFDMKLLIEDRYININDTNTVETDGVLNLSFDIAFYDGREYEGLENNWIDKEFPKPSDNGPNKEFMEQHPVELMEVLELIKE